MSERVSLIDSKPTKWVLAIVAFISCGWSLFQSFHTKSPRLQYEIVSQVKLFNEAKNLSKIQLLVDTVDIIREGQNISYYVLMIHNIGNQHLRWNDYDEGRFGIVVNNGNILQEVNFVEASSPHIEERFRESQTPSTNNFIFIPSVSLDKNEWYSISFSVIHRDDSLPSLMPVGKIIGQEQILVSTTSSDNSKISINDILFSGGIWAFLVRAFAYFIIWLIIVFIISFSYTRISELIQKRKRETIWRMIDRDSSIPDFVKYDYFNNKNKNIHIAEHYYSRGEIMLGIFYKKLHIYLSNPDNLDDIDYDRYKSIYSDINRLIKLGYVIKGEDGELTIPRDVEDAVDRIQLLLKQKKIDYNFDFPKYTIETDSSSEQIEGT